MASRWFFRVFGGEMGPVSFQELAEMARAGTITEDDYVRREIGGDWMRAGEVIGLFGNAQVPLADTKPPEPEAPPRACEPAPCSRKNSAVASTRLPGQWGVPKVGPRVWLVASIVLTIVAAVLSYGWSNRESRIFPDSAIPMSERGRFLPNVPEEMRAPRIERPSASSPKPKKGAARPTIGRHQGER